MKALLDKLSSYNIFNNLLPGVLFSVLGDKITSYRIIQPDLIYGVFIYYFIGLLVNRVGSLIVEPALKTTLFIRFPDYSDFVTASKRDNKLELLLEVNNMYRTFVSLFLCLVLLKLFDHLSEKYILIQVWQFEIFITSMSGLFLFSYRKQTKFITERISTWANKE